MFSAPRTNKSDEDRSKDSMMSSWNTPAVDKTVEFSHVFDYLLDKCTVKAAPFRRERIKNQTQSYSEFMYVARRIGKSIINTCVLLDKLNSLVNHKSLFLDCPEEIEHFAHSIKEDLGSLVQQTLCLQQLAAQQTHLPKQGQNLNSHCTNAVLILQSKLTLVSEEFRRILECRNENEKEMKMRREQYQQTPTCPSFPSCAAIGGTGSVLLTQDNENVKTYSGRKQLVMIDETDSYIESRRQSMQNIESTIIELGKIFQSLAHIVREQEEAVKRIDSNVADTDLNVESAQGELVKQLSSVNSNRWLIIKIFGTLVFMFTFFVIFLV